ncbi:MAG: 3-dehydroquinate synthase [Pseudomonadota bacterium]
MRRRRQIDFAAAIEKRLVDTVITATTLTVDLGIRSYPIVIGNGVLGEYDLGQHIAGSDCLIVTNDTIGPLYLDACQRSLSGKAVESIALPDGEEHKTTDTMHLILDKLVSMGANRDVSVIALGGGVVGDIAGFAASCYMRGVGFLQVPTTLLAQVDSSVGGKTGVNLATGKNLVGAFYQPDVVLIDTNTLSTLDSREFSAGLAEVIKYGAIVDADFFAWLETNLDAVIARDTDALIYAIRRSCELKAEVVADDEREQGRRAILNFGHTFGHAIEKLQGYGDWLHGEAVAAGMVMAATLSGLSEKDVERLRALIAKAGLPVAPPPLATDDWLDVMAMDKKVQNKTMRFVLLYAIGDATVSDTVSVDALRSVIEGTQQ